MDVQRTRKALKEMRELLTDVGLMHFIPKRFRSAEFTPELRDQYCKYLEREITKVEKKLNAD